MPLRRIDSNTTLNDNEAFMQASLYYWQSEFAVDSVTNFVTNRLGNVGQRWATVTNSVTKLRAIQGNDSDCHSRKFC